MKGFEKFESAIAQAGSKILSPILRSNHAELEEVIGNHLFDDEGSITLSRQPSSDEKFYGMLLSGFSEIASSYESLQDIEIYVTRFPFSNSRVSKARYLRFVVEAYLHEVYILQQRLSSYLKTVQRQYRKHKNSEKIKDITEGLGNLVTKPLEGITRVRGTHVHQSRYTNRKLDKLKAIELVLSIEVDNLLMSFYEIEYRKTRKEWKTTIKVANENIRDLLDNYFDVLYSVVFTEQGDLQYPNK
ncbi:MAG: hypothetical protein M3R24_34645 [Chloroflexota bacterium]|nr:hypothetical protein [Chloroflexota bacterium]